MYVFYHMFKFAVQNNLTVEYNFDQLLRPEIAPVTVCSRYKIYPRSLSEIRDKQVNLLPDNGGSTAAADIALLSVSKNVCVLVSVR